MEEGGKKANTNGAKFEETANIESLFEDSSYFFFGNKIFHDGELIGGLYPKHSFYKELLEGEFGCRYQDVISRQILPDNAFYNAKEKAVTIIEDKYQEQDGSVDEKLQCAPYRQYEFERLLKPFGIKVNQIYIFNDWFKQDKYRDVLEFLRKNNVKYFFNSLPSLKELGV